MPRTRAVQILAGIVGVLALTGLMADEGEGSIPVLRTKTKTYTNVTITVRNETHVCFLHDGGASNVPYVDLEPEAYALAGYLPPVPAAEKLKTMANEQASKVMQALPWEAAREQESVSGIAVRPEVPPEVVVGAVAVGLLFHLFFSYCSMLICHKVGTDPGLLVWLPVFQIIPMLRAAGMSGWWILAMPLPFVGLVVWIVWCFKLVSARGKNLIWGILMLLPLTNVLTFLYLAFSGSDYEEAPPASARLAGLSVRTV